MPPSSPDQPSAPPVLDVRDGVTDDVGIEAALARAAEVLLAGGTVVVPTDTVYGLAALPHVRGATRRLFELKGRDDTKPLAVLTADEDQAFGLVDWDRLTAADAALVRRVAARAWPGALTFVLPRRPDARDLELGGPTTTIGLRCPASAVARGLAARVGPFAATSANPSGDATPSTAREAAALPGGVDLVLDAGDCREAPSTVVSVSGDGWIVLRRGALDVAALGAPLPRAPQPSLETPDGLTADLLDGSAR